MTTPADLSTNRVAQDKLADDAVAAIEDAFAQRGLILNEQQTYRLTNDMTKLVRDICAVRRLRDHLHEEK